MTPIMMFYAFLALVVLLVPTAMVLHVVQNALQQLHERQLRLLEIRRLEAIAAMSDATRQHLLDTMPAWLDATDVDEIEAWQEARQEVVRGLAASARGRLPEG